MYFVTVARTLADLPTVLSTLHAKCAADVQWGHVPNVGIVVSYRAADRIL
jgi:hypothetical protein